MFILTFQDIYLINSPGQPAWNDEQSRSRALWHFAHCEVEEPLLLQEPSVPSVWAALL